MKIKRPQSLNGLILVGFGLVALPLLFAIVWALFNLDRLAEQSERLVLTGVSVAERNRILAEQVLSLERGVRTYDIIARPDTLTLLRHGAVEANPLLEFVLREHPHFFAVIKMGLTGIGVLVLVAAARAHLFRVVRVKTILQWLLLGYALLFGYEMWLLRDIF